MTAAFYRRAGALGVLGMAGTFIVGRLSMGHSSDDSFAEGNVKELEAHGYVGHEWDPKTEAILDRNARATRTAAVQCASIVDQKSTVAIDALIALELACATVIWKRYPNRSSHRDAVKNIAQFVWKVLHEPDVMNRLVREADAWTLTEAGENREGR